jgi:hypothetical protein
MTPGGINSGGLSPRLIFVWILLALLLGAIAWIEFADRANMPSIDAKSGRDPRRLLPVDISEVGFERDTVGNWYYHGAHAGSEKQHGHQTDPALAARIAKSLSAFDRARMEREFPFKQEGDNFGVVVPSVIILVYRPKELAPFAQYAVGDLAVDTVSRYVHVMGSPVVITLPNYQIENLLALIKEVAGASGPAAQAPR